MSLPHTDPLDPPAPEAPLDAPEGEIPGARDWLYLGVIAVSASVLAFVFFFLRGDILLYGDATAHIHIARRVFDSRTPTPFGLGTVWLPLPHVLMLPFILSTWAWRTGIGGSVPSMAAYVLGVLGIFRLVRRTLSQCPASSRQMWENWDGARIAAWAAALIFAANPNLLYLQATAMTEPLYLALFIWALAFFSEFVQATRASGALATARRSRALSRCAWVLFAAMLTRYDGWFAAGVFALTSVAVLWRWTGGRIELWRSPLRPVVARFILVLALAPLFWFTYNAVNWGNPLEFATGPYSARAIESHAERVGGWHYPGWHVPRIAAAYFLKSAKLNVAAGAAQPEFGRAPLWRLENAWLPLALMGTLLLLVLARAAWPLLLSWVPLLFYVISITWGDVPIFLGPWWPYSYYNVRYGVQLLPALAVSVALLLYFAGQLRWKAALGTVTALLAVLIGASYIVTAGATPVCLREARASSARRIPFEREVAAELRRLPPGATLLAYTASHAAVFEFAGFPLRRTINETNRKLWRGALADPARATDYVLAFTSADDPVWRAVQAHADELQPVAAVELTGEHGEHAAIYRRR